MNDWILGIVIYLVIGILIVGLPEVIRHLKYEIFGWADWKHYLMVVTLLFLSTTLWPLAIYLNIRYKYKKKKELAQPTQPTQTQPKLMKFISDEELHVYVDYYIEEFLYGIGYDWDHQKAICATLEKKLSPDGTYPGDFIADLKHEFEKYSD